MNAGGKDKANPVEARGNIKDESLPPTQTSLQKGKTLISTLLAAKAAIIRIGKAPPDDDSLKAMFDNSLPIAYQATRQLVRMSNHGTFLDHYNDYMAKVRAEVSARAPTAHAFTAHFLPPCSAAALRGALLAHAA